MGKQNKQQQALETPQDSADRRLRLACGEVLRMHRTAKKLTQQELGIIADTDSVYISRVESGKHSLTLEKLFKLAESLGVTPWEFVKDVSEKLAANQ